MSDPIQQLLAKYGVPADARISAGMEAEVYACGADAVLKVYAGKAMFPRLERLTAFYQGIRRDVLPFALPRIRSLAQEEGFCVTIEERLPGQVLAEHLSGLSAAAMDAVMCRYLDAVLALSALPTPPAFERHLLWDMEGFSRLEHGDWHAFLRAFLQRKLASSGAYLARDVADYSTKLAQLDEVLRAPYTQPYHLIHGDFFPGNLLVDEDREISGLLDFGLFTMQGDAAFDLATAWVFFDMYDELQIHARERLLEHMLDRLGLGVKGRLYRYVLIYSLLSANTYSADCADGHYRWCVNNLNREEYWADMV